MCENSCGQWKLENFSFIFCVCCYFGIEYFVGSSFFPFRFCNKHFPLYWLLTLWRRVVRALLLHCYHNGSKPKIKKIRNNFKLRATISFVWCTKAQISISPGYLVKWKKGNRMNERKTNKMKKNENIHCGPEWCVCVSVCMCVASTAESIFSLAFIVFVRKEDDPKIKFIWKYSKNRRVYASLCIITFGYFYISFLALYLRRHYIRCQRLFHMMCFQALSSNRHTNYNILCGLLKSSYCAKALSLRGFSLITFYEIVFYVISS